LRPAIRHAFGAGAPPAADATGPAHALGNLEVAWPAHPLQLFGRVEQHADRDQL